MFRSIQCALAVLFVGLSVSDTQAQIDTDALTLHFPVSFAEQSPVLSQFTELTEVHGNQALKILPAMHWHQFQQGIRRGQPGLYIASPHFAAWAIHEHGFQPIIKLAGTLSYVIAVARNDAEIFEMNDLAGRTVCSSQPLKLDYLLVNRAFDNPVLSARIQVVESVAKEMRRANSECRGFSLTNQQYQALALEFPNRYIRVQQSIKYSNLALIADTETAERFGKEIETLQRALQSENGRSMLQPLFSQWSSNATWVGAQASDYPVNYAKDLVPFWR